MLRLFRPPRLKVFRPPQVRLFRPPRLKEFRPPQVRLFRPPRLKELVTHRNRTVHSALMGFGFAGPKYAFVALRYRGNWSLHCGTRRTAVPKLPARLRTCYLKCTVKGT